MIDRLFTAALTFSLLIGTTVAIASAWFDSRAEGAVQVVRLPSVEVTARRPMPAVDVAASKAGESATQRVQ
jgi:hypothetical protein